MGDLLRFDPIARRVGAGTPVEKMTALVEADDASERVASMDPFSLYNLIREVGLQEGVALIHLATGEQVQSFLDFNCWGSDRFDLERFTAWLALLVSGPHEQVEQILGSLDPELLGFFFLSNIQIYLTEDEDDADALDHIEGHFESSPDGVYTIVMPDDEERAMLVRQSLRRLYAYEQDEARQLLQAARAELPAQLEETAHQMREGRIQQWGFLPPSEAAEIFAWIEPSSERSRASDVLRDADAPVLEMRVGAPIDLPASLGKEILELTDEHGSFFGRALRRVADGAKAVETTDGLLQQIFGLANRSVSVTMGGPTESYDVAATFRGVQHWLNLGLEYLSSRRLQDAERLLLLWPLKRIFRVGFSLTAALASEARALHTRGNLTLVDELPASLCTPHEWELIEGLLESLPVRSKDDQTRFETLVQVAESANRLSLLAFKEQWAFGAHQLTKDDLASLLIGPPDAIAGLEEVTFDALLATAAALDVASDVLGDNSGDIYGDIYGDWGPMRLLSLTELNELLRLHLAADAISDDLANSLATVARMPHISGELGSQGLATRWADDVASKLINEYGRLSAEEPKDPRFLPKLFLVANEPKKEPSEV